ncbi:MAG: phosphatase [Lachnospiraceae bacterium]
MQDFDIHTHSIASGHGSRDTIADLAKAAALRGLSLLGISDHGPATPGSASASYFRSLTHAPKYRCGIRVLYGVELNILDEQGTLDLDSSILKNMCYTIASLHTATYRPGSMAEHTRAYLHAMDHPYVKIIGHADDGNFPVDYKELVLCAKEKDVLLEINNASLLPHSYRPHAKENCTVLLSYCKEYKQPVILTSDSHGKQSVGDFSCAQKLLEELAFPSELVITRSSILTHYLWK